MTRLSPSKGATGIFLSDFSFLTFKPLPRISVAIIPNQTEWGYKAPKSSDGRLHPDAYWFAIILDIRARTPDDELWIRVSWFYARRHLEELVKVNPAIQALMMNPFVIFDYRFI